MFNKIIFALCAIAMFSFVSSADAAVGCKKFNFLGSFARAVRDVDVTGDMNLHTWIFQLYLNSDGTARQSWSGGYDIMMNGGLGSDYNGSWKCRDDGKLVLTFIEANYGPIAAGSHPGIAVPDIALVAYLRTTSLFSVDNDSTLTRISFRNREYGPNDDPTDPNGGVLDPLRTSTVTYTRFVASDADLNLP